MGWREMLGHYLFPHLGPSADHMMTGLSVIAGLSVLALLVSLVTAGWLHAHLKHQDTDDEPREAAVVLVPTSALRQIGDQTFIPLSLVA